jgi:DASS family divalent anion:Na+ symporter
MASASDSVSGPISAKPPNETLILVGKWAGVLLTGLVVYAWPAPDGISDASWRLFAIFLATIVGTILRPVPGGAMVLLGIVAVLLTKAMPLSEAAIRVVSPNPAEPDWKAIESLRLRAALGGYADPVVWLVLAAFFMSRAMVKTGLGRRIALLFIRKYGRTSLGLGYALVGTDFLLASVVPSNGARCGGITFPIAKSVAEAYDSRPGETARKLGAFLMTFIYQCEVIVCAVFLTGQAGNLVIRKLTLQATQIDLSYSRWFLGGIVPGLVSLVVTGLLLYRIFPPEITHTPAAREFAQKELIQLGGLSRYEKTTLVTFVLIGLLWGTTNRLHSVDYSVVALVGICGLLLASVLSWEDVLAERAAWDVFIWYGGMVRMAEALGETGITKKFAQTVGQLTTGWKWGAALAVLALIYFFAHYAFASITAHALAMLTPFLIVVMGAGAPTGLVVLLLAYFSNLSAGLTHYGTTPGPIYFGAGYVTQQKWWQLGLLAAVPNILIWSTVGVLWWKILGWW